MIRRSAVDKPVRSSNRTIQVPKRYQHQSAYPETISPRVPFPDPRYNYCQQQHFQEVPSSNVIHSTPPRVDEIPLFDFDALNDEPFLSPEEIMLLCE